MKSYAIVLKDNHISENAFETLIKTSESVFNDFSIERFDAVTPNIVSQKMSDHNLTWNYPWENQELDVVSGLLKIPYSTKNKLATISCALSHYELWKECVKTNENILILEHNAFFKLRLDFVDLGWGCPYDIIGINDPRGAILKSEIFYNQIDMNGMRVQTPPYVNSMEIPQGLAGNSAYIIKPSGAKQLLDLCDRYGLWPNDAIMCRQLVKNMGTTRIHYTGVQECVPTTL